MSSGDCDKCVGEGLVLISEARMEARIFRGTDTLLLALHGNLKVKGTLGSDLRM
uniref:Uncharacterized protein n=1 Tax=Cucumis sativus TaxID=3659 RepID=A0A0A0KHF7_CUCSA